MIVGGLTVRSSLLVFLLIIPNVSLAGFVSTGEIGVAYSSTEDTRGNQVLLSPITGRITVGYYFFDLIALGNAFDVRYYSQFSEANALKENFSGLYYSYLSPFVAIWLDKFLLAYEHRLQGEYGFSVSNEQGDKLSMFEPQGFRLSISYKSELWGHWGLYFEENDFQRQKGGFLGEANIEGGQKFLDIGLVYIITFGEDLDAISRRGFGY